MPKNLLILTKLLYSDLTCIITYLTSAMVGTFFKDSLIQFLSTLFTLSTCSILVFYLKKWLERKDQRLNKDGGLFSFIVNFAKSKFK